MFWLKLSILPTIVCAQLITVPTGHVAVWYKWNNIQDTLGLPGGLHAYNPITTSVQIEDATSQMDPVEKITCITKDKQTATFPLIQVWNQLPMEHVIKVLSVFQKPGVVPYDRPLIYDPVVNFIKETCSDYTGEQLRSDDYKSLNEMVKTYLESFQENRPELNGKSTGIKILRVFVEIPRLSKDVEENYQKIAIQKTEKQAEEFRQVTELKKKETQNKLEQLEAEKRLSVAATFNLQEIQKKEAGAKIAKIDADSSAEVKRIATDAESYSNLKKAQDNEKLLTPPYLQKLGLESYGCQNVIHYGDLPNFLPNSLATST